MKNLFLFLLVLTCSVSNAQLNHVLYFDGSNDYVDLGNGAATGVRSIEFWFRPEVDITPSITDVSYTLVGRNDATQQKEFGFLIRGSEFSSGKGCLNFYISNGGTYYDLLSDNNTWAAGTWYHVCGTIDPVSGMKLYVNGVQQTMTNAYASAIPAASEITALGRWGDMSYRYFPGSMDELRFWDIALTEPEIVENMCDTLVATDEASLIGYWKMDEGSGAVLFDETDYDHDGANNGVIYLQDTTCTLSPPPPPIEGNFVLYFDGVNDYVDLGNNAATSARSIEFWFKPEVDITPSITDVSYTLVGRDDATQQKEFGFLIRGSEFSTGKGCLNFYISNSGTYYDLLSDNNTWTAGTWYHVCGTIDPVSGMKLYVNGAQQAMTNSYAAALPASPEITALGRWGDMSYRYFTGSMDELRFWDVALTQSEIVDNMCDTLIAANESSLIGYWKMDEGGDTILFDETDYNHIGTNNGVIYLLDTIVCPEDLGLGAESSTFVLSIYPNPFTDYTIFQTDTELQNATLIVYDAVGQQVNQLSGISGNSVTLYRDFLAEGIYFFELQQSDEILVTGKFLIVN